MFWTRLIQRLRYFYASVQKRFGQLIDPEYGFGDLFFSIRYRIKLHVYDNEKTRCILLAEQDELFKKFDFDRQAALDKIDSVCKETFGYGYDENKGMFSEHLVLFAAISLSNKRINDVLEIGTYNGLTSVILSKLFPNAQIVTIDLPVSDEVFVSSYRREPSAKEFAQQRDATIEQFSNINFLALNSVNLSKWNAEQFDLIWVDGAHGYPIVAIDLVNAHRIAKKGAYVLMDDIRTFITVRHKGEADEKHSNTASFEVLNELVRSELISDFTLFLKRVGPRFNIRRYTEKYVGLFIKEH